MKPALNPKTLQAAVVLVGGMLVIVSHALIGLPGLLDPRWVLLIGQVGALLGGKEALKRTPDFSADEVESILDAGKSQPPQ
jgi:hypothetical protein